MVAPAGTAQVVVGSNHLPEERTGKNRLHIDFSTGDWAAEVDRVVGLGAKRVGEFDEFGAHWVTLADPEGNVFDLAEQH